MKSKADLPTKPHRQRGGKRMTTFTITYTRKVRVV